ncbi:MAG: hypothetical protein ACI92S_001880, partial [Planctomycetaceae bacterium]
RLRNLDVRPQPVGQIPLLADLPEVTTTSL